MTASMIYSRPPVDRRAGIVNGLTFTNRFAVSQLRWHYRQARRAGLDARLARSIIWNAAWIAEIHPPTFVPFYELDPSKLVDA